MEPFTTLTSRVVVLPGRDVDTDQITPARFLKVTAKSGLGQFLFYDWRRDEQGQFRPDFPINQPRAQGASILLAGDNFGCGSSREHAPWALLGFGFRAVISSSFADIFRNNSLKNGLLPIIVDPATHAELLQLTENDAEAEVTVDLATETLRLPTGRAVEFPIDAFSKHCLLTGVDQLGYLLQQTPLIAVYEVAHPVRIETPASA